MEKTSRGLCKWCFTYRKGFSNGLILMWASVWNSFLASKNQTEALALFGPSSKRSAKV